MAPNRRCRKDKEVVQEFGQNHRPHHGVQDIEANIEQIDRQIDNIDMEAVVVRFHKMQPTKFYGTETGEKARSWLIEMEYLFDLVKYSPTLKLQLVLLLLKDRALLWWDTTSIGLVKAGVEITWEVFKSQFQEQYTPPSFYAAKEAEFNSLVQVDMTVTEYASQFSDLLSYVPYVAVDEKAKRSRFVDGLHPTVHTFVVCGRATTYAEVVETAKIVEASLSRRRSQFAPQLLYGGAPQPIDAYQPSQSHQTGMLQEKEKKFKKSRTSSSRSSGSRTSREEDPLDLFCGKCGGTHHIDQCRVTQSACFACGQIGHFARVCPARNTGNMQPEGNIQIGQTARSNSRRIR